MRLAALLLCLALVSGAARAAPCDEAAAGFDSIAADQASAIRARAALEAEVKALAHASWAPGYCRAVADNLAGKLASKQEGVQFGAALLIRTTIKYEAFRVAAFRSSGVAPKLYFGFLDQKGATAAYETKLLAAAAKVAPLLNAYARENNLAVRVSPKEIAVTQIAEGGALLLTKNFAQIEKIHPVYGVGLDDYRIGFRRFPGLTERLDAAFGSHLDAMTGARDVSLTFIESVLGTAVMYLYEKDLAEQKLRAENRPSLASLPLDEQFVTASLVYNSGILFAPERIRQILHFDTATYLDDISIRSAPKRPRLPVMNSEAADVWLAQGKSLPEQPTSWNAVYHVLQRYGAWTAISRYSEAFDDKGGVKAKI